MRTRSLKQSTLQNRYDAIVIGSGLGGLVTARLLAERGMAVLVLERHYVLGGYTHVFRRKGWEWDVGVHYVGEVHQPHNILRRLFDRVTDGKLEWASMGDVYDRMVFPDEEYEFRAGVANFKEGLKEKFGSSRDADVIDRYVELVFAASSSSKWYHLEKTLGGLKGRVLGRFLRRGFLTHARRTTHEVLRGLTDNPRLAGVLAGQWGDYGLPPRRSSFAMHALVARHYFRGGNYPVGGSERIAAPIVEGIERAGGTCVVRAEVERIRVHDGRVAGVQLTGGRQIDADIVISNAGVTNTYERLLPRAESRVDPTLAPSQSHACLYLGLDGDADALGLPRANDWIYPTDDHDRNVARYDADPSAPPAVVYISYPSAKDPDFARRHPGKSTVELITMAPWDRFARWEHTHWKRRPPEYETAKRLLSDRLLGHLFERRPQLRDAVLHQELSTPLSTRHFMGYQHGELYGLSHDPARFEARGLRPATEVPGLFLTGQDITTCGIGGALFAGFLTASVITDENLLLRD